MASSRDRTSRIDSLTSFAKSAAIALTCVASCALVACAADGASKPAATAVDAVGAVETSDTERTAAERLTSVEIAEFEVNAKGADRFIGCPPPGELGQKWIPEIPEWKSSESKPASKEVASPAPSADSAESSDRSRIAARVDLVIEGTRDAFRRCYLRGLFQDPTQDGRVAIVLRIGADGRVVRTESFGACDLSSDAIVCMRETAQNMRFSPPEHGSTTLIVPVVRVSSERRTNPRAHEGYQAESYVALESGRPGFHACEEKARASGSSPEGSATYDLDVDAAGHVAGVHIDPWQGDQDLVGCAAGVLQNVQFAKPPAGRGKILVRLRFNPRRGTR